MAKHTPGPWVTKERTDGLLNIYNCGGVTDVAICVRPRDAGVIVAAPDLLAFANCFLAECGDMSDVNDEMTRLCKMAADAVRKADGAKVVKP